MAIQDWSKEKLDIKLEQAMVSAEFHQACVNEENALVVEYRTELNRRAFENYWKSHPQFLQLNLGDNLLVTERYLTDLRHALGFKLGDVFEIIEVNFHQERVEVSYPKRGDNDGVSLIGFDLAADMRKAWLEREGQEK